MIAFLNAFVFFVGCRNIFFRLSLTLESSILCFGNHPQTYLAHIYSLIILSSRTYLSLSRF